MSTERNWTRFGDMSTMYEKFGVDVRTTFSEVYPHLNKMIMERGNAMPSRYGNTMEILNFQTVVHNPQYRCVGGLGRNINIFFLIAEALWIWSGQKDVAFLEPFNSTIAEFSDDGKVFHAPYGWRLRKWGMSSNEGIVPLEDSNRHAERPEYIDQIRRAIFELGAVEDTRRVVMSIWNPNFDLGHTGVDLPCNDLVMPIIRDGALHMTIANRSNDLHWGLPTNIFQFSFILEFMAGILNKRVGTQTHNSRSLHVYDHIPIAKNMLRRMTSNTAANIMDKHIYEHVDACPMDFNFNTLSPTERLEHLDNIVNKIMALVTIAGRSGEVDRTLLDEVYNFSSWLGHATWIIVCYRIYVNTPKLLDDKLWLFQQLINGYSDDDGHEIVPNDLYLLAFNGIITRLKSEDDRDKFKRMIVQKDNVSLSLLGDL